MRRRWTSAALLAVALTALGAAPGGAFAGIVPSGAGIAKVTEYTLPPDDLFPGAIAMGPTGDDMWFTVLKGQPGVPAAEQRLEPAIGRITIRGEIREFSVPSVPGSFPYAITAGNDGAMWFLAGGRVGRITQSGQVTEFPMDTGTYTDGEIVSGSDGNLWFTKHDESGNDAIVRVTLSGQATEFPLPPTAPWPQTIVPGPDGNLWFTEVFGRAIGRITPDGAIAEFPIRRAPLDIVAGHDGNLWFTTKGEIGHISTSGHLFPPVPVEGGFGPLAAGPDLRLWFAAAGGGALGRITPDGRRSLVRLPTRGTSLVDMVAGFGTIWYLSRHLPSCSGGGGSCQAMRVSEPGVIGRIEPLRPKVWIRRDGFSIHPRWAGARLACLGGEALGRCRGWLSFETVAGLELGRGRFEVRTDTTRPIAVRLYRDGRRLFAQGRRLALVAKVEFPEGSPTSRRFVIPKRRCLRTHDGNICSPA